MKQRLAIVTLTGLLTAAALGAATPHRYLGSTGGALVVCDPANLGFDVGGVCIPAGHVGPGADGTVTISILDDLLTPTSGRVCQDLDDNGLLTANECQPFCGSITLEPGVNWEPAAHLFVFVDGPQQGHPLASPCGMTLSAGTTGEVHHT